MEQLKNIIPKAEASLTTSSPTSSTTILKNNGASHEVSIFFGAITEQGQLKQVANIRLAFPQLESGFFQILLDRVNGLEINDARLEASVNHVIDNCVYPTPTIAQFLSFDKTLTLLNREQYVKKNNDLNGGAGKYYRAVRIKGHESPYWAHVNDIEQFKLKPFNQAT